MRVVTQIHKAMSFKKQMKTKSCQGQKISSLLKAYYSVLIIVCKN